MDDYDGSSWSTVTDPTWQSDWNGNYETDELYAWYEDQWHDDYDSSYDYGNPNGWQETWYEAGYDEEPPEQDEENANEEPAIQEKFYKGKGKSRASTMGLGCSLCGSKWHNTLSVHWGTTKGPPKD